MITDLKNKLYKQCLVYVQQRMEAAQLAIDEAQKASNDDTKSSAGDKYETGRAMMQQETDRNRRQMEETNRLKVALNRVNPDHVSDTVEAGSVVITDQGNFYMAIGAGALRIGRETYFAISPASPIGLLLAGKKTGEKIILNGKPYAITMVI